MAPYLCTLPVSPDEPNTAILRFENPHYVPLVLADLAKYQLGLLMNQAKRHGLQWGYR